MQMTFNMDRLYLRGHILRRPCFKGQELRVEDQIGSLLYVLVPYDGLDCSVGVVNQQLINGLQGHLILWRGLGLHVDYLGLSLGLGLLFVCRGLLGLGLLRLGFCLSGLSWLLAILIVDFGGIVLFFVLLLRDPE